jgi:hypothetical protein
VLENRRVGRAWITITLVLLISLGQTSPAQSSADQKKKLTLEEAVDFALKNYPAVRAALERVKAAKASVGLARTNYLPRADMVWQTNRATDNNITGLVLPQSIIAPISGPVPIGTSNRSAWGSAAGLLFSWEPLDLGYRGAKVGVARAARDQATAEASLTRLDVAVATVNAYLTVLAAQRTLRAADADVERRDTFDKAVRVLVDNQLRAGADSSRADAELARARVNLARAQQQEKISRAALADILGLADTSVEVVEGSLLEPPPDESPQTSPVTNNPVANVSAIHGAQTRMRPILMTSMAMIAGMIPMALGIGEGAQQTAPLGRAVIGGLSFATAATLLILPVVFSMVQERAGTRSPSLDPDDPRSAFAIQPVSNPDSISGEAL